MKHLSIFLSVLILCCFNCCAIGAEIRPLDKIVVVVNDSIITQSQIDHEIVAAKQQLKGMGATLPSDEELRKQVIDNLIAKNIQLTIAKKNNIEISDTELDEAIANIAKRNNITSDAMMKAVIQSGISVTEYRQQIRDQITISRLQQQELGPRITVTDQEIDSFMNNYKDLRGPDTEYHVENILIPLSDEPSTIEVQKSQQQAHQIMLQVLKKGADFRQLAAAKSADSNALQGGDFGWRKLVELPEVFAKEVQVMQPGQIVGPIRAPNGFHIIKLIDVRQSAIKLTRDQAKILLYQRKFREHLQDWVRKLRNSSYVKIV